MGRRCKGARLWLRPERRDASGNLTHSASWFILDGSRQIATGCIVSERAEAENFLLKYQQEGQEQKTKYVYFVTTDHPDFPIKIGISEVCNPRFTALQVALPYRLKVLAIAPSQEPIFERRLHRRFAHIRLHGEWFSQTVELLDYISTLVKHDQAA